MLLAPRECTKLTAQSVECVFLRYSAEHKGYRCWDPVGCRIRISQEVTFDESCPFYRRPSTDASHASVIEPLSFLLFPNTPIAPMFPPHLVSSSEVFVESLVVPSPMEPSSMAPSTVVPSSMAPSPMVPSFSEDIPQVPMGTAYDSKLPVTRVYTRTRRAMRSSFDAPSPSDAPSSSVAPSLDEPSSSAASSDSF